MKYLLTEEKAIETIRNIRSNIELYFKEHNLKYAIFGKSGGLDSSVITALLSQIEGVKPIGVVMPCESDPEAERIAKLVLNHFKVPFLKVDITREYHYIMGHFYSGEGVHGQLTDILKMYDDKPILRELGHRKLRASGNIKARLRMITLYHIAQLTRGVVISTDNLSELMMGFWTLNGDVGDFAPIQHVWKGLEEYTIARALGVPVDALEAAPTDGLDVIPNGTDEDQLGLPYSDLDRVIISLLQNKFSDGYKYTEDEISKFSKELSKNLGYESAKIEHVAKRMLTTNFKRKWPKVLQRKDLGLAEIADIRFQ